jgi:glycosyltransferase involved in cell wall biosynthesis
MTWKRWNEPRFSIAFLPGVGHLDYYCGASESVFQIAKHTRHAVLTITEGPYGLTERLKQEGLAVSVLPSPMPQMHNLRQSGVIAKARFGISWLIYGIRLFFLLRKRGVKLVYTANAVSILAAVPVKLAGAALITGIRGEPGKIHKWKWVFKLSDCIALLSKEMKSRLLKNMPESETKIVVIYNGVDLEVAHSASDDSTVIREQLGLGVGEKLVLYVGAFRLLKGQLSFIQQVIPRCFSKSQSGQAHFALSGSATERRDEDYESTCRRVAEELDHRGAIHFLGYQKNIWPWYAAADIVVLASESEGMPRCVIEAMASGTPVVTFDVCSTRELLEANDAGIVVPLGDYDALSRGILELLDNPELGGKLGANGHDFACRQLDVRSVAAQYDSLFDQLGATMTPQVGRAAAPVGKS